MAIAADCDLRGHYRHPGTPNIDGNNPYVARSAVRQNLIFEELFDGGALDSNYFVISGNAPTVDQTNDWMVSSLERHVDPISYRTEISLVGLPTGVGNFDDGRFAQIGETYWYGVSIYIPAGFVYDSTDDIILQLHGKPDVGEDWRSPPVSLRINDTSYKLIVRADSKAITGPAGTVPDSARYTRTYVKDDLALVAPTVGKWTNWVFHIKWGYDNTGFLTIYQEGVSIYSETGIGNCFNDDVGPYFKMGIYKDPWRVGSPETETDSRLYYHDNFRIGNANATLADVWEDHS